MNDEESRNQRIYTTILELLEQRGYKDREIKEDRIIASKKEDIICVFTNVISKFNIDKVKECINILNKMDIRRAICIYKNSITPIAKKAILNMTDYKIELFMEEELLYNITKHRLVPLHIPLCKEKSREFKELYGDKIPIILKTDPISKFLGFQRGDIIKIVRNNGYITYRLVR